MEITIQNEVRDERTLLVDGEPWRRFSKNIFGPKPQFISNSLSDLSEEFNEMEKRKALAFTLRRLAQKSYHSDELTKLLEQRFVQTHTISEVIAECTRLGYLNDQDFVNQMVHSEKMRRGGPQKVLWKVRHKGIKDEDIEVTVKEKYPEIEQADQIKQLLSTRYKTKDLSCAKDRQKVFMSLVRRGFDFEVIQQAMRL